VYIVAICNPNPPRRSQRRIKGYDLPWLGEVLKGGLGGVGVGFLDLLGFLVGGFQGDLAGFCLWFRCLTYAS
jgi:hypothetical protein